ncbi:MAG: sodium:proton antiporter [Candidatus Binatia bacterium]|nr:sodium:proton antiporter [Candidatus Binatia bacterium]
MQGHPAANIPLSEGQPGGCSVRRLLALFSWALVLVLAWAALSLPSHSPGLVDFVHAELEHSGVVNPVTAVLLNFRSYDTLLEVGVLLLAVFGVWALPRERVWGAPLGAPVAGPVLHTFVRLLAPLMIVVGGYLLWIGAYAPGGAFQGGAVLAAMGVLVWLSDLAPLPRFSRWDMRMALLLGFATFLAVAGGVMVGGGRLLEYPRLWAGSVILLIETALTVSIACILILLFLGGVGEKRRATEGVREREAKQ